MAVNTLRPIYVAIAIATTYARNPIRNARKMGGALVSPPTVWGRLYSAAAKLLPHPSLLVMVNPHRRHLQLRLLRTRFYRSRQEEGASPAPLSTSTDAQDVDRAAHSLASHRTS